MLSVTKAYFLHELPLLEYQYIFVTYLDMYHIYLKL